MLDKASSMRRATILSLALLLSSALWARADSKSDYPVSLKVLSAKTESVPVGTDSNDVPTDCDIQSFSAYCHGSRREIVRNTMLVQDGSGKSFTIACTVDSRWSNCISLPVGETFGAQKEKHGFTVWYQNSKGKEVKQSYELLATATTVPASAKSPSNSSAASSTNSAAARVSAASTEVLQETVKCNFTSTPSGAEITLDGRYVGNTPSTVGVRTGTHVVVLFMPGFDRWTRELTVSPESQLNVSATLQKTAQ